MTARTYTDERRWANTDASLHCNQQVSDECTYQHHTECEDVKCACPHHTTRSTTTDCYDYEAEAERLFLLYMQPAETEDQMNDIAAEMLYEAEDDD